MTPSTHDESLNELVNRLAEIREDKIKIEWIMKDGIWMPNNSMSHHCFCDLILIYYDNYGIPIELKSSRKKRNKAIKQLEAGKEFIRTVLGMDTPYGKFVTYDYRGDYRTETISI